MRYDKAMETLPAGADWAPGAFATKAQIGVAAGRILFIDNVRSAMIVLVLGMHAAVTYSPLGSWYYREHPPLGPASTLFFATFQGVLQGFFMALLFFIAGYFAPPSYDAKGAGRFLAGRVYRLGLPTALYVLAIGPFTEYYVAHSWRTSQPFAQAFADYLLNGGFLSGSGPMWFCVALVIFSSAYAAYRLGEARRDEPASAGRRVGPLIGPGGVGLTIAALAVTAFLVRIVFPMGTSVFNLQLCYFPSYIILFSLGLAARRYGWITGVTDRFAWVAAGLCVGVAMAMWLPLLVLGGALSGHSAAYAGGLTWQSAGLSLWEALICVGMSFGMLAGFRAWAPGQGAVSRWMSDNAFAVYVIHPPILICVALMLSPLAMAPVGKFTLLWILSGAACFGVAAPLARRIPLLGRIL